MARAAEDADATAVEAALAAHIGGAPLSGLGIGEVTPPRRSWLIGEQCAMSISAMGAWKGGCVRMPRFSGGRQPGMFAGMDLKGRDFSRKYLVGADFTGADCRACDFRGSDLSLAKFTGADLYEAKFEGAILYVTEFGSTNLTRAEFRGAFAYGFQFRSSSVITYADLRDFQLEKRRRSGTFEAKDGVEYLEKRFGGEVVDSSDLCASDYQVNGNYFTFRSLYDGESHLLHAQIFNTLKRLYRENHDGRAALRCHFQSRSHLTRSRYKRTVLTAEIPGDRTKVGRARTALYYLAEFSSGYGVRPCRMVGSLAILYATFLFTAWVISAVSVKSGVAYEGHNDNAGEGVGSGASGLIRLAQFAALSLVSPQLNQFSPYGWMIPLSLLFFTLSACFLALLFSSLFMTILSE